MRRVIAIALVTAAAGCGSDRAVVDGNPDSRPPACEEATRHQDLGWVETNVFATTCVFAGCHDGTDTSTRASRTDLRPGFAYAHLVGATSDLDSTRQLVVPGAPARSYLLVMLGQIAPSAADPPAAAIPPEIGTMPQGTAGGLLCTEEREAIERWIVAGAPPP